jgi:hypothetical protein
VEVRHNREYELDGNLLLTNDSHVVLTYVRRVTDPAAFDPMFMDLLALDLAMQVVMPLTQDKSLYAGVAQEFGTLLVRAKAINDAADHPADKITWVQSRRININNRGR